MKLINVKDKDCFFSVDFFILGKKKVLGYSGRENNGEI